MSRDPDHFKKHGSPIQKALLNPETMEQAKEARKVNDRAAGIITVMVDGSPRHVERRAYVRAKHRQLVEFGYPTLTLEETDRQVDAVLDGKEFGEGLTVIGMFMQEELEPSIPAKKGRK